ncbi:tRNA1(Val) (adenine(37)-N6)-methyltransferase [Caviibacterium pharyngocola]|uniref:tRNA1(Val) (adenine(37)-N6)-methyltransferase n=1 Tax=Caviibacterium pharyngocola TaxID=28159 RepID=A0A2M8RWK2_9PAST|nr:tRNA1(Val) (adenine(37)-N6)-methyltransferase [Caviibacterium pharyngocola]PJG83254.1 tRNA (adenosine(37)-N6)-methyltransferase TrmM [Caviibacterium pharyngocola]
MASNKNGFTFKQFHVNHDRCAMKVGTDGVLLGAWADVAGARNLLDFGTGSGLVALMLAQRSAPESRISAVEIDPDACLQAQENIDRSPWAARMRLYRQDILEFARNHPAQFDLITANPPYFEQSSACRSAQRTVARYTVNGQHSDWLNAAETCLTDNGNIHFILPFDAGEMLLKQTALYCAKRCEITTKQGKDPHRILLTFSKRAQPMEHSRLTIYTAENRYHPDFIRLIRDFYLKY